jgi:hypothetical protein
MLNPDGNCTLIAIYDGLKCKDSSLLKEYNINKFEDIRELLKNGSSKHSSLQKHYVIQDFIKSIPNYYEDPKLCETLKNKFENIFKRLDNDENGFHIIIYLLISLYFDIEIIFYEKGVISYGLNYVNEINKSINRNINETLRINVPYTNHVEYMPLENEKKIYNKLYEKHELQEELYYDIHIEPNCAPHNNDLPGLDKLLEEYYF